MSKRNLRELLVDMLEASDLILDYTKNISFEEFSKDRMRIDAVIRNIEILGEAAKQIPTNIKEIYSDIEWSKIAKTRDKLIHAYFSIALDIIWDITENHIPALKNKLNKLYNDLYNF